MGHDQHHEHLLKELVEQLAPVFSQSPQAVYLYLDDVHKVCNKRFSDMLGYASPQEWVQNEFPISDILEEDQNKVVNAYGAASRDLKASSVQATCVTKDGKKLPVSIIMVPQTYRGEVFVLHFISEK